MAGKSALTLLKEDHESLKELLVKLTATTERGVKVRQDLLKKIEQEIREHTALEEEIVYPSFKQEAPTKADQVMYHEAKEEHHAAEKVLKDLLRADVATNAFGGKAKVLSELIHHHIQEEEKELFPRIDELMSQTQLRELGSKIQTRREAIRAGRAWERAS